MPSPIIAITGAGGLIGSSLVRRLQESGQTVVPLFRGSAPVIDVRGGFADLTRADHMRELVAQGFRADLIVHLAGLVDIIFQPGSNRGETLCLPGQLKVEPHYLANVVGTANVVDLARACGASRIIFASSQTVYGYGEQGRADETTPLRPLEHYAASKVCAEQLLAMASRQGLSVVIVRFPGIYSPLRASGAVHAMCRSAVQHRVIEVHAECAIPFDVLALEDVVTGIVKALSYAGESLEIFNLSSGEPCSLELLAGRIGALVPGTRIEKRGVAQPPFQMSGARAARLLQWQPAPVNLRLAEMLSSPP